MSLFFSTPKITVYLPQEEYASLSIENDTGDITIPDNFSFESISITVSTGDVSCDASAKGPIFIKTSTGHIRAKNISAEEMALSVSTGKVDVSSVICEGDMNIAVSTGKTMLKNISCRNLFSTGSTGDITLEDVIASGEISIVRSTGDVTFDHSDADELSVKTDTGDVIGPCCRRKYSLQAVTRDASRFRRRHPAENARSRRIRVKYP